VHLVRYSQNPGPEGQMLLTPSRRPCAVNLFLQKQIVHKGRSQTISVSLPFAPPSAVVRIWSKPPLSLQTSFIDDTLLFRIFKALLQTVRLLSQANAFLTFSILMCKLNLLENFTAIILTRSLDCIRMCNACNTHILRYSPSNCTWKGK